MLTVTKPSSNRVDIDVDGGIDAAIMSAGLDQLITYSDDVTQGQMLIKITELDMPTLGAIGVEFTRLTKLFGLLSKFDRCAVLSDQSWIRTMAELEGAILPGLAIKSFHHNEAAAAEAWIAVNA